MNIAQLSVGVGPYYIVSVTRGSPNPLFHRLPERLSRARKAAKLTRRALEQKAGGTNGAILYIEEGRRMPTVATVARIAAALGVHAAWLAYGIGEEAADGSDSTTVRMAIRLVTARTECAISRAELGRRAGLSPRAIAKVEAGGQSGVDIVEALAKALGVSPAWLAYGTEPKVLPQIRRGRPPAQSPADTAH